MRKKEEEEKTVRREKIRSDDEGKSNGKLVNRNECMGI